MIAMTTQLTTGRTLRRWLFLGLVVITTLIALGLLTSVFLTDGISPLELFLLILYAVLFAWICASFWTATIGFIICVLRRDSHAIATTLSKDRPQRMAGPMPRTAIVMPIYNEDPARVFAGLRAIYQNLSETGQSEQFDFFILSDTRDPDIWIEEEIRWYRMCLDFGAQGRLFYRNRTENIGRKSGNIADFCKHWGERYRYMVVLDADSVMSGAALVEMVRLMERNPKVALIQVPPVPVNRESLFARILQFASRLYGGMFTAGLNFWQLGEGNYWGHNAIIRVKPFVEHCGLPKLPGKEPFGGEILSHDFVEAGLLCKAGWEVWLAYDLGGSYEEIPPTLIDYAKRDRRWCQGNLQHTRLVLAHGWHPVTRAHLLMGVMSYLASPLWLVFLIVTGLEAFVQASAEPVYFFGERLFPVWPVSYTVQMTTVLIVTLAMLFLPKLLGLLLLLREAELREAFGGFAKASVSVVLESLFSMLLAPVLMLFQSKFVLAILFRRTIGWPPQQRGDHLTGLKEAVLAHSGQTLLGIVIGVVAYQRIPNFFWWFVPVLLGLLMAIPLSMLSSSLRLGRQAKKLGLFLTAEETQLPRVLQLLGDNLRGEREAADGGAGRVRQAIVEPFTSALHTAMLPPRSVSKRRRHYLEGLVYQLLEEGLESLSATEKRELLSDQEILARLHTMAWSHPHLGVLSP
jgi:membrane glycosyltransferase